MAIQRLSIGLAIATLSMACGGSDAGPAGRAYIQTLSVQLSSQAPFAKQVDFPARLETTIEAALAYWDGSWADLQGVNLSIVDEPDVPCSGHAGSLGCFENGELRITTRDPGLGTFSCIEETVLVHEIGHAVIGDRNHTDPRWMQLDWVSEQLSGRVGYTVDGEGPCPIYLSVWRHPLGSP